MFCKKKTSVMSHRPVMEVFEVFKGYAIKEQGRDRWYTLRRCICGSRSYYNTDPGCTRVKRVLSQQSPNTGHDWYDVFALEPTKTNRVVFEKLDEAVEAAKEIEKILGDKWDMEELQRQQDRARAAFVEKKVWR